MLHICRLKQTQGVSHLPTPLLAPVLAFSINSNGTLNEETIEQQIAGYIISYQSIYLKGRNFRGKKISRISRILAKFAKKNPFLTPENVDPRKLIPAKCFKISDLRKLIPAKFFQKLLKCLLN